MSEEILASREEQEEEVLIEQPENIRGVKLDPNSYTAHRLVCLFPPSFFAREFVGLWVKLIVCMSVLAASCYPWTFAYHDETGVSFTDFLTFFLSPRGSLSL